MDCKEVSRLLAAYLDNEVTAEERRQIEAHLESCPACRRELDELAAAQDGLRRAFKMATTDTGFPGNAWNQLEAGLGIYRPSFLSLLRTRRRRLIVTVIAAAVIITLAVLWGLGILPGFR